VANTAQTSSLGFVGFAAESAFADTSTNSATSLLRIRDDMIDVSGLQRPLIERGGVYQRFNEGSMNVPGPFGLGTFTITHDLHGHGATTLGALTARRLHELLAHVWGGSNFTAVGTNTIDSGSTATSIADAEATMVTGAIARVGTLGDGRGGGQAAVIADDTSAFGLLTALGGAPNAADDLYAMGMLYPVSAVTSGILTSSGASSNNTLRFVLATTNLQYVCRGCACTGVELQNLGPGEVPRIRLTFSTVAWEPIAITFPSGETPPTDYAPAPCTGGSLFIQAKGTTTRNVDTLREFSMSVGQGMVPVYGNGGSTDGQNVVGWRRVPAPTRITFAVEAQAATACRRRSASMA
jgi:hypothetical protein